MSPKPVSSSGGGENRGISVGRDASGNAFVTGDNNQVKVIVYHSVLERRERDEPQAAGIGPNPYVGLLAFHEEDADHFFGREQQVTRLWEKLRDLQQMSEHGRLLPILGPSGSGKSSLARAGLIPELARRPLPGWRDARIAVLTPSSHPIGALAGVLARIATRDSAPVEKTEEFERVIRRQSDSGSFDGLKRIAEVLPEIDSMPLIVVVDQFEEIYSLCDNEEERNTFISNLLCAVTDPAPKVSAIVTLRTDFMGETQGHPLLNSALADQGVIIPAMNKEELRRAIASPARLAGHVLDDDTVNRLVRETEGRVGALPLLQFALTRIWEGLQEGAEPADTLAKIGGVGGALAGEAQRIYDNLPGTKKTIARRVFLGLVQLGEGTRDTRRRVVVASLVAAGEDRSQVEEVVRRFSAPGVRLITLSAEPDGRETAEVTHEALFEHWRILDDWLAGSRDDLRFHRRLDQAARNWEEQQRARGILWRSPDLEHMRSFRQKSQSGETPLKLDQLQTEFCLESERAEAQRRGVRWGIGAALLLGLTLIANWYAVNAELSKQKSADTLLDTFLVADTDNVPKLLERINDVRDRISPRLRELEAQDRSAQERIRIALALLSEDNTKLSDLNKYIVQTDDISEWKMICNIVMAKEEFSDQTIGKMLEALRRTGHLGMSNEERINLAKRRARAAITLIQFGKQEEVAAVLYANQDPDLLSQFAHSCRDHGVPPLKIEQMLREAAKRRVDLVDHSRKRRDQDSLVFALLLALAEYDLSNNTELDLTWLQQQLEDWYESDPSSSVHSATRWFLQSVFNAPPQEVEVEYSDEREWFTMKIEPTRGERAAETEMAPIYLTFVVFGPGNFKMGSPPTEPKRRDDDEHQEDVRVMHRFAMCDREITVRDFETFATIVLPQPETQGLINQYVKGKFKVRDDGPMIFVNWYEAVLYCRWLTETVKLGEDDQCYHNPVVKDFNPELRGIDTVEYKEKLVYFTKRDVEKATGEEDEEERLYQFKGFRLPTQKEWEFACRGGLMARTYSFGASEDLMPRYGVTEAQVAQPVRTLRPNYRGLFDMHGNVREWCHGWQGKPLGLRPQRGGS